MRDDRGEMKVLICSTAELRKRVGTVIPLGVERFVGTVGLDLPEVQEVSLATRTARRPSRRQ